MRWLLGVAVLVVLVVSASIVALAAGCSGKRGLQLDGVGFEPELALRSAERSLGLMHREQAPRDGMLFVYRQPTVTGFWMRDTLVPLAVVFFDRRGARVQRLTMTPCGRDPCRIYRPRRSYSFALELPADDTRPARQLGPAEELERLRARAD